MLNRPMVWVAGALVVGTLVGAWGFIPGVLLPSLLSVSGCMLPAVSRRASAAAITLAFFGAGVLLWNVRHGGPPGDALSRFALDRPESSVYLLEGMVERPDIYLPGQDYAQFYLRTGSVMVEGTPHPIEGGVLVRWSDPGFGLFAGDRVRVQGPLELELSRVNWNTGSIEDYLRRRDIHTAIRIRGADAVERVESGPGWSPVYWASRLRNAQAERFSKAIPESSLPFALTVWLGDRRRITNEKYQAYIESGTAHILAVSGVHMGIVFVSVTFLLRLIVRPRRIRTILTMAIVLIFALTAGARISSLRAAIMLLLYLTAELFDRDPDAPTALSLAGILFILHDSDVVLDGGFQLSFLSVSSILLFREPIENALFRLPFALRQAVAVSLAVQILAIPAALSLFHVLPTAGPAVNLIVIPLLSVALWLAFLTSACSLILPVAAPLFGYALHPVVFLIEGISQRVAGVDGTHLLLVSPTAIGIGAYWSVVAIALAAFRFPNKRKPLALALVVAVAVTFLFWKPLRSQPEVVFLDVGHGDAAFIRTPEGATFLVDGGDRTRDYDVGRRYVAPFLWSNHISHLDGVFASHADSDHMAGLIYIVEKFDVDTLYLGPRPSNKPLEEELLALCRSRGVSVRRIGKGDRLTFGDSYAEVLHPPREWAGTGRENDYSLALRFVLPGFSVLFTGDVEAVGESEIVKSDCRADILKVPHHGSITSSTASFIRAVNPAAAVISTGRRAPRPVISDAVLERYASSRIATYRTDRLGGIRVVLRDGVPVLEAARVARGYPTR